MTGGGRPWRGRDGARAARALGSGPTAGALLARVGRVVLWLAVAVVLVRGVADTLAADEPDAARRLDRRVAVASWPDDAARAFAVQFATAYLTHSPTEDPGAYASELEAFASPELVGELAPRFDGHGPGQRVRAAVAAGTVRLDARHALVTVAAMLGGRGLTRRFVTVPVARDRAGGVVVDDLPAFFSAPARARVDAPEGEPLLGTERAAIEAVLRPFLRAYLAGDGPGLAYLVPAGTQIAPAAGRWALIDLTSLSAASPASRGGRVVLATVRARDTQTRTTYALRYRLRLVRRDRWYVAEVLGAGRRGR